MYYRRKLSDAAEVYNFNQYYRLIGFCMGVIDIKYYNSPT